MHHRNISEAVMYEISYNCFFFFLIRTANLSYNFWNSLICLSWVLRTLLKNVFIRKRVLLFVNRETGVTAPNADAYNNMTSIGRSANRNNPPRAFGVFGIIFEVFPAVQHTRRVRFRQASSRREVSWNK